MSDSNDIKVSDAVAKVLDDLEKVIIEYDIEEAQAKRISGRITLHRRDPNTTTH